MGIFIIQPSARNFDVYLATGLAQAGMEPVFIYTEAEPEPGLCEKLDAEWVFIPVRSRLDFMGIKRLLGLVGLKKPQIIYCGTALQCFVSLITKVRWPADIVLYRGAVRRFSWISPSDWMLFKSNLVSLFHCNSNAVADSLTQMGIRRDRISVFPGTGYPKEQFQLDSPITWLPPKRAAYRLGAVANYRKVKGLEYFVDAAQILVERGWDLECMIVGDDPQRKLENYVRSMRGNLRVIMTGAVTPAWPIIKTFDCLVVPSLSEGLPKVIIEAFACGVPVVGTSVGGIPELLLEGQAGCLVEPANPKALAEAIETILLHPDLADRFRKRGVELFVEHFEAKKVVERYVKMFRGLLSRK